MDVVTGRRSIRSFRPDSVPEEAIGRIIEAARWAPSSANSQPWDIVVVRNLDTRQRIQESVQRVVHRIKERRDFPFLRTFTGGYLLEAPVQLVMCGDPRFQYVSMMHDVDEQVELFALWGSVSMAVQNMLLAAHAQGLGSVVFTNFYPHEVKELLGVPDPLKVICILPVGYPAEPKAAPVRRRAEDFTHLERFDASKLRSDELVEEAHRDPYGVQVKNY
ncbi:MAG: nitroreductase family protein [Spirochaetales bacterium]|nr:nitroreductase family protein [Spirochaetales bacterium]